MPRIVLDYYEKENKDYSNIPFDYGKYIENKKIQEPFKRFLEQEEKISNNEANHYWIEANDISDSGEKIRLLLQGAKEGSAVCAQELGLIYLGNGSSNMEVHGIQKNYKEAEKYLKYAAECGFNTAMGFLGLLYSQSDDDDIFWESFNWLCKAVINGEISFYNNVAYYCQGANSKKAFETYFAVYFRDICDKENRTALENLFLGWCFFEGICCVQNLDFAEMYWEEAKEQGDYKVKIRCEMLLEALNEIKRTLR